MKIIVCGLNGAGKSTFGRALADYLGFVFRDIEDYYFTEQNGDYKYQNVNSAQVVCRLLLADLQKYNDLVLASVTGNYGEAVQAQFTHAVYLRIPEKVRAERVRDRSFQKFGARMLEGGDLYEKEKAFFDMVMARGDDHVLSWLGRMELPILELDGTRPIGENLEKAAAFLGK